MVEYDKEQSVETIINQGKAYFFPNNTSQVRNLDDMQFN